MRVDRLPAGVAQVYRRRALAFTRLDARMLQEAMVNGDHIGHALGNPEFARAFGKLLVLAGAWTVWPVHFYPPHVKGRVAGWEWEGPTGRELVEGSHNEPPPLGPIVKTELSGVRL
jgi:hypothetical protein